MAEAKVEVGDRVIDSVAALDDLIGQVAKAQELFKAYSQEQVDAIFRAAALKANENRIPLAQLAFNETGMGILEDKVVKNHYASEEIYHKYKDAKTCGIIQEDVANGLKIVAEPLGVLAGVIPTTNPTSTVIFKSLIALKTRNAIIFSPHPRAVKSTIAAAKIMRDAAVATGAPQDIIGWIDTPTLELTSHLMQHPKVASILATGGPGMVRAAYTSGKP
ncbi:MAG: aldehyde dehydrogenase family protein, partial [Bacteriovoracaceae bacterium]|nr:aldehyde dehydrogenase family protein [Bacteriovoracaceae bacterium]